MGWSSSNSSPSSSATDGTSCALPKVGRREPQTVRVWRSWRRRSTPAALAAVVGFGVGGGSDKIYGGAPVPDPTGAGSMPLLLGVVAA